MSINTHTSNEHQHTCIRVMSINKHASHEHRQTFRYVHVHVHVTGRGRTVEYVITNTPSTRQWPLPGGHAVYETAYNCHAVRHIVCHVR